MKKIIIALSALVVSVGFTACNDFLDEMPDNRTQIDNVEKVKSLLVTAYPSRVYAAFLEPRCDGYIDHGATLDGTQPSSSFSFLQTAFRWDEYPSTEGSDDPESYWLGCYSAISAANHALQALDRLGHPKGSAPYKAEAQLCRAYAHFCLLTIFSNFFDEQNRATNPGIPYVTEPEDVINKIYERGTVASTLEKIKADLAAGMQYVGSASDYKQPKFHFTLNAARMLALRIALFERDYPAVIQYANMLLLQPSSFANITSSGKPLVNADGTPVQVPHPSDQALIFCKNNLFDWITTIADVSGSTPTALAFTNAKNANIILATETYSTSNRTAKSIAYTRYAHGTKEFSAITTSNPTGQNWRLPSYGYNGAPANAPSFIPKTYEDFKASSINASSGQPYVRFALFRMEEALLARAEAFAMTGEYDKALYDLTMYAQRRTGSDNLAAFYYSRDKVVSFYEEALGLSDNYLRSKFNSSRFATDISTYEGQLQRGLVLSVLDARQTEYIYEGMRWFDILRWNIPVTHALSSGQVSTLTPDDDRRVIQIPETSSLSGLEKNRFENIPNPWN